MIPYVHQLVAGFVDLTFRATESACCGFIKAVLWKIAARWGLDTSLKVVRVTETVTLLTVKEKKKEVEEGKKKKKPAWWRREDSGDMSVSIFILLK